jgi:hypothetical protein
MKIAFLVLNHRPPAQVVRLVATLRTQLPDAPIVVHHDIHHGEFPAAALEPTENVHLITSGQRIIWGDFSQVAVLCWSLAWLRNNVDFDWVVLLSAQDYPIKPLAGLADYLAGNGADAVFRGTPINQLPTAVERRTMSRRYYYQYRPAAPARKRLLPDRVRDVLRWTTGSFIDALNIVQPLFKIYRLPDRIPYRFGWRARRVPFDRERPCWQGSSWFALSRRALEYVLDYLDVHPDFVEFFRATMNPDESMLATIVFNAPELQVANRNTTYTRWSTSTSGHPDILRTEDLAELAAVPQFFARKFDLATDGRVLDELDALISAPGAPADSARERTRRTGEQLAVQR